MNNMIKVFGLMVLVATMSAASVMAQENGVTAPKGAHVEKRIAHQKKKISKKLSKGKINKDQAAQLNGKVDAVQAQEQTMVKNGKLSKKDRKELNKELNVSGKEIKEAKVPAGT